MWHCSKNKILCNFKWQYVTITHSNYFNPSLHLYAKNARGELSIALASCLETHFACLSVCPTHACMCADSVGCDSGCTGQALGLNGVCKKLWALTDTLNNPTRSRVNIRVVPLAFTLLWITRAGNLNFKDRVSRYSISNIFHSFFINNN